MVGTPPLEGTVRSWVVIEGNGGKSRVKTICFPSGLHAALKSWAGPSVRHCQRRLVSTVELCRGYNRCAKNGFIAPEAHNRASGRLRLFWLRERFFVGCSIRAPQGI